MASTPAARPSAPRSSGGKGDSRRAVRAAALRERELLVARKESIVRELLARTLSEATSTVGAHSSHHGSDVNIADIPAAPLSSTSGTGGGSIGHDDSDGQDTATVRTCDRCGEGLTRSRRADISVFISTGSAAATSAGGPAAPTTGTTMADDTTTPGDAAPSAASKPSAPRGRCASLTRRGSGCGSASGSATDGSSSRDQLGTAPTPTRSRAPRARGAVDAATQWAMRDVEVVGAREATALAAGLRRKDAQLARAENEIAALHALVAQLQEELAGAHHDAATTRAQLAAARAEAEASHNREERQRDTITHLQYELDRLRMAAALQPPVPSFSNPTAISGTPPCGPHPHDAPTPPSRFISPESPTAPPSPPAAPPRTHNPRNLSVTFAPDPTSGTPPATGGDKAGAPCWPEQPACYPPRPVGHAAASLADVVGAAMSAAPCAAAPTYSGAAGVGCGGDSSGPVRWDIDPDGKPTYLL